MQSRSQQGRTGVQPNVAASSCPTGQVKVLMHPSGALVLHPQAGLSRPVAGERKGHILRTQMVVCVWGRGGGGKSEGRGVLLPRFKYWLCRGAPRNSKPTPFCFGSPTPTTVPMGEWVGANNINSSRAHRTQLSECSIKPGLDRLSPQVFQGARALSWIQTRQHYNKPSNTVPMQQEVQSISWLHD